MFIFSASLNPQDKAERSLVVFSGQLEGDDTDYGSRLEIEFAKVPIAPDNIIFIYPKFIHSKIAGYIDSEDRLCRNLKRFGSSTRVFLFSFGDNAKLTNRVFTTIGDEYPHDTSVLLAKVIGCGIMHIASQRVDSVIQQCPPGTIFVKPSEERFEEFIKASELAVGYSENQFLAFALLSKRPHEIDIRHIWIDTSGIASIAEALTYYLFRFSDADCKPVRYHSFRSYEDLEKLKPDYTGDIWMIISASTSNNLGKKAARLWGLNNSQVITILSYKDSDAENIGDEILSNIASLSRAAPHMKKSGTEIGVKIHGENFVPEFKDPQQVVVKAKHKPDGIKRLIYPFRENGAIYCNRLDRLKRKRELYLDVEKMLADDPDAEIEKWLRKVITWISPVGLKWAAYNTSCPASEALLSLVKPILDDLFDESSYQLIDMERAATDITGDGAVLILAPIITSGSSLLRLNRNLRMSKHNGNRLFVVPFVTAPSRQAHTTFLNTIKYGPDGLKYTFLSKEVICVGDQGDLDSWTEERRLIENFQHPFWKSRADRLSAESTGITQDIGVPCAPSEEPLQFTQDFAFWPKDYIANAVDKSAVYATIATTLQELRQKPFSTLDEDSLAGSIYQHAVIDPDTFLRLDDPILHSCLWRAARHKELDYSSSEPLSKAFIEFASRIINQWASGEYNAGLDLLVGLATKKIKLSKSALTEIVDLATAKLADNEPAQELLNYIDTQLLERSHGPTPEEEQVI